MARRKLSALAMSRLRSAITNGARTLVDVDHRTAWMRRLKDLIAAHISDAGGEDAALSEGQLALIRRAAMMEIQLEMLDTKFANNEGCASSRDLDLYGRTSGNLRRVLESLGLHQGRKPREINAAADPAYRLYEQQLYSP